MQVWRIGLAALAALVLMAQTSVPPVQQIIAAERAFAADGLANGIRESFPRHAAPDGIMFAPDVVVAREFFAARPPETSNPGLDWWPAFAGASRAGDLGFTTGPVSVRGQLSSFYFTVWRRQADGRFQWIFDGGSQAAVTGAPAKGSRVQILRPSGGARRSQDVAREEVLAAEVALAADARTAQATATYARLAPDARIHVDGQVPATTRGQHARTLAAWPDTFEFDPVTASAISRSGDLAFVYGEARWRRDGRAMRGRYVRIWQHRASGWRIVFAQIIARP